MNTPIQPTVSDLLAAYRALAPGPKLVLRLKSLMFLPTNRSVFIRCLTRPDLRRPTGKPWSAQTLSPILADLQRQKLLTAEFACTPSLLHPITIDAVSADSGALPRAALAAPDAPLADRYSYRPPTADILSREIRLVVYACIALADHLTGSRAAPWPCAMGGR